VKLLLDHNISHKLVARLADVYPASTQTRLLNFGRTNDPQLWRFAKADDFILVTKDGDIARSADDLRRSTTRLRSGPDRSGALRLTRD
jgi:predicted nuclease of predicted toxin-antitoxin system